MSDKADVEQRQRTDYLARVKRANGKSPKGNLLLSGMKFAYGVRAAAHKMGPRLRMQLEVTASSSTRPAAAGTDSG